MWCLSKPQTVQSIKAAHSQLCGSLGRAKGRAGGCTEFNGMFVRQELCDVHGIQTYTPDEAKPRTYETAFFHGFDGEVFVAGDCTLLWHEITCESERSPAPSRRLTPVSGRRSR